MTNLNHTNTQGVTATPPVLNDMEVSVIEQQMDADIKNVQSAKMSLDEYLDKIAESPDSLDTFSEDDAVISNEEDRLVDVAMEEFDTALNNALLELATKE